MSRLASFPILVWSVAVLASSGLLTGCSLFGYYKYKGAPWAPPAEAEKVDFPDSYEHGLHLDGPTMAALEVARNEFMPPGAKAQAHTEELARCLTRRDIYEVSIVKASDDLFFVSFYPQLSRCDLNPDNYLIMDAGATYAIDGHGRVLAVQ